MGWRLDYYWPPRGRPDVGRMPRLTSLAPDIIEAILRGDEPDGLSLRKLQKNLPVRWDKQRRTWPGRAL